MNFLQKTLLSLLAVSSIGTAVAGPISINATVHAPAQAITSAAPFSFMLDIRDVFVGNFDAIGSAILALRLTDPLGGDEKYAFAVGSGPAVQLMTKSGTNNVANGVNVSLHSVVLNDDALADLNFDGLLKVSLSATAGNYSFVGWTFLAEGVQGTPVPEPLSLALMGIALVGVGAARRRKA